MSEALDFGWKVFADKQVVQIDSETEFTLSNFKIAVGPLIFGHILSISVLVFEIHFKVSKSKNSDQECSY